MKSPKQVGPPDPLSEAQRTALQRLYERYRTASRSGLYTTPRKPGEWLVVRPGTAEADLLQTGVGASMELRWQMDEALRRVAAKPVNDALCVRAAFPDDVRLAWFRDGRSTHVMLRFRRARARAKSSHYTRRDLPLIGAMALEAERLYEERNRAWQAQANVDPWPELTAKRKKQILIYTYDAEPPEVLGTAPMPAPPALHHTEQSYVDRVLPRLLTADSIAMALRDVEHLSIELRRSLNHVQLAMTVRGAPRRRKRLGSISVDTAGRVLLDDVLETCAGHRSEVARELSSRLATVRAEAEMREPRVEFVAYAACGLAEHAVARRDTRLAEINWRAREYGNVSERDRDFANWVDAERRRRATQAKVAVMAPSRSSHGRHEE